MNVLPVIKSVVGLASSLGAGSVVGNAIKATTPADPNMFTKVFVTIGGIALSGIAGDMAAQYVEKEIQKFADDWKKARVEGAAAVELAKAAARVAGTDAAREALAEVEREHAVEKPVTDQD